MWILQQQKLWKWLRRWTPQEKGHLVRIFLSWKCESFISTNVWFVYFMINLQSFSSKLLKEEISRLNKPFTKLEVMLLKYLKFESSWHSHCEWKLKISELVLGKSCCSLLKRFARQKMDWESNCRVSFTVQSPGAESFLGEKTKQSAVNVKQNKTNTVGNISTLTVRCPTAPLPSSTSVLD